MFSWDHFCWGWNVYSGSWSRGGQEQKPGDQRGGECHRPGERIWGLGWRGQNLGVVSPLRGAPRSFLRVCDFLFGHDQASKWGFLRQLYMMRVESVRKVCICQNDCKVGGWGGGREEGRRGKGQSERHKETETHLREISAQPTHQTQGLQLVELPFPICIKFSRVAQILASLGHQL